MSPSLPSVLHKVYGSLARSAVYRVTGVSLATSVLSVGQPTATQSMAIVRNTTPVSNTPNLPHGGMAGLVDLMNVYVPNGPQLLRDLRTAIAMGTLPAADPALKAAEAEKLYQKMTALSDQGGASTEGFTV